MGYIKKYPDIKPKGKPLVAFIIKVMLFCLGRAFPSLAKSDPELKREVEAWQESFTILFEVHPHGPYMSMQKKEGRLHYLGLRKTDADLVICVKHINTALLLFTGFMGTPQAYAEHRVSVKGDLSEALRLIRCLNIVLCYLFPAFIARNTMKRLPVMKWSRLWAGRTRAYLIGVPFGI